MVADLTIVRVIVTVISMAEEDTHIVIDTLTVDLVKVITAIGSCILFLIPIILSIISILVTTDEIFEDPSSLSWW